MPTYAYHCKKCGHALDVMQKITESALKTCPECGQEALQRGPGGGIGLQFQGTGFYITDYASGRGDPSPTACQKGDSGGCCPCSASPKEAAG